MVDVPDAHHLAVLRARRHLGRRERVVAPDLELVGHPRVDAAAVVRDAARLPVEELARLADRAAEGLDDGLVAETDAERGRRGPEPPQQLHRHTRILRTTRTGGYDESVGPEGGRLVDGDRVV